MSLRLSHLKTDLQALAAACALGLAVVLMAGCSSGSSGASNKPEPNAPGSGVETWERVELLTDEVEKNLSLDNLDESLVKLNEILKLDPQFPRAVLWKSMIGISLEIRGIGYRLKPLYLTQPDGEEAYSSFISDLSGTSHERVQRFFMTKAPTFHTHDELQEWIDRVTFAINDARLAVKAIKDKGEFAIRTPEALLDIRGRPNRSSGDYCHEFSFGPVSFFPTEQCEPGRTPEILLNQADLELVQQSLAMYQSMISYANLYRTNMLPMSERKKKELKALSAEEQARMWFDHQMYSAQAGSLRSPPKVQMRELARDLASSIRFLHMQQQSICGDSSRYSGARPGYLVSNLKCLDEDGDGGTSLKEVLRYIEGFISGSPLPIKIGKRFVQIPVTKIFDEPPRSIRGFLHLPHNGCGSVRTLNMTPFEAHLSSDVQAEILSAFQQQNVDCEEELREREERRRKWEAYKEAEIESQTEQLRVNAAEAIASDQRAIGQAAVAREAVKEIAKKITNEIAAANAAAAAVAPAPAPAKPQLKQKLEQKQKQKQKQPRIRKPQKEVKR